MTAVSSLSRQALNLLARQRESQPGLCSGTEGYWDREGNCSYWQYGEYTHTTVIAKEIDFKLKGGEKKIQDTDTMLHIYMHLFRCQRS